VERENARISKNDNIFARNDKTLLSKPFTGWLVALGYKQESRQGFTVAFGAVQVPAEARL
jgi:hypothetical protein